MKSLLTILVTLTALFTPVTHADEEKNLGTIWFIGDSITQSNADGDKTSSPRLELHKLLTKKGHTFTYTGHFTANIDGLPPTGDTPATNLYRFHSGVSGATIGANQHRRTNITASIPRWWNQGRLATAKPNVVLIMLGTNDIGLNDAVDQAPTRIKQLVETIHAQLTDSDPAPHYYIAQIPPNRQNPAATKRVLDFNQALPVIVEQLKAEGKAATLVDQFTPIDADKNKLMADTLHTNTEGNKALAQQWLKAILSNH